VFQVVLRDIGKSFQSAITAPRIDLTGYGNATAQSYPFLLPNEPHYDQTKTAMWERAPKIAKSQNVQILNKTVKIVSLRRLSSDNTILLFITCTFDFIHLFLFVSITRMRN